jgi:hypothetical protein
MKTSRSSMFFVLLFCVVFALTAKTADKSGMKNNPEPKKAENILFKDMEIDGSDILQKCETMKREVSNAKIKSSILSINAMWFGEYANHPKIEEETDIRREWYKKMSTLIGKMHECKYKIESLQEEADIPGNLELAKKGEAKYLEMLKVFNELAKHPEKIKTKKK